MKPIIKNLCMLVAMLCASISATAYDFDVDGIAYTITSLTDLTVGVDQLVKKDITKIAIPESVVYKDKTLNVTSIKDNAFKDNTKLTEISLPNTINSIGHNAFFNDSSLVAINTPYSLSYIGSKAFYGCSSITTFYIPEGVKGILYGTFYGCKSLKSIELPASINSIEEAAFCKSGLQSIVIPSSVVSLGDRAFANTKLIEINLPDGIETIPKECFSGCTELLNITFGSKNISSSAFKNCIALQQISLPENLTVIGAYAFRGCTDLIEFSIPSEVISIEPSILWDCPNISKLTIGRSLKGLPVYANYGMGAYSCSSLGGYYLSSSNGVTDETYLQDVKEFIIEDSDTEFSIKGFHQTPPFANANLDYYYVGRPLVDIKKWNPNKGNTSITVNIKQGSGSIKKLEINGSCTSVPYFYQRIDTLKLGKNIKKFDLGNIYKEDIVKIECLSEVPPACSNSGFPTKVYTDAILCVPFGCKEAYANAEVWKNFWNIYEVDIDSESGITEVFSDKDDVIYHVYNIVGLLIGESYSLEQIKQLPNGIYIIVNKYKKYKIKI